MYVQIIGVLLATIWVSKSRADAEGQQTSDEPQITSLSFRYAGNRGATVTSSSGGDALNSQGVLDVSEDKNNLELGQMKTGFNG